jgi:hypothetical protein
MVKNPKTVVIIVFLFFLLPGARTARSQPLRELRVPFHVNDNFLLNVPKFPELPAVRYASPASKCRTEGVPAPLTFSLEPTASDRSSEGETACPKPSGFFRSVLGIWPGTPRSALAPVSACDGFPRIVFSGGCFAQPPLHLDLWDSSVRSLGPRAILGAGSRRERFHARTALLQSTEFLLFEHAFRLANDPYARYLLFHKPFWKDYLSSAGHFDMSRWGDGDDFLVNYIGHPLEGSVSGNIFLQNDPQGRSARFGRSSAYWQSRFKAMAWAAVYSAYFEIGPVLSEAALGNEGGYTYVPGCGFYPTCRKEPGENYKPPTNNTGWVDFVVTPTIGMGWIVLEDFIEADLVDKLADGRPDLKFKILRGALAPSRSMSNFLAGRPPWYRAPESREVIAAFGSPVEPLLEVPSWKDDPRWNLGAQLTSANLPADSEGCSSCRVFAPGVGLSVAYRLTRLVYLDSEFNVFPGAANKRGRAEEGLFGVRVGRTARSWGLFTQVRPGFIHFDKPPAPESSTDYQNATLFAFDLGGSVEYYASRHSTIRFNMGTTLVHYPTGRPDPNQPPVSVLSGDYYVTRGSFRVTSGYVFRF